MLFVLFQTARSIWWDFNLTEFGEKKKNSLKRPIFVVCHSKYCPHCSGLPQGTREYSDGVGNRTDMYVTMIDCYDHPNECGVFAVTGTPHMVLVVGQKRRYWPRIWIKDGNEWNKFIDLYVKSSLREIKTDEELNLAKREPSNGGTTFHLETPSSDNEFTRVLSELSKEFRIYNDSFTYRINKKIGEPMLTAWTSPLCETKFTGNASNVRDFVEQNRFGSRHQYDWDEYKIVSRRYKTAMVVVEDSLRSGHAFALERLPEHYCNDVKFGSISFKKAKKDVLREFGLNNTDLPVMVYANAKGTCRAMNRGRTAEAESSGFLPRAVNGELCGKTFLNGVVGGAKRKEQVESTPQRTVKSIGGLRFSGAYIVSFLSVITLIRTYSVAPNKGE